MTAEAASPTAGRHLVPEWAPHDSCVMAWCEAWNLYPEDEVLALRRETAAIAEVILGFEHVVVLAHPDGVADARDQLAPGIEVIETPVFDTWTRDTLPTVIDDGTGAPLAVGWTFNVWGEKFPGYADDRGLGERAAPLLELPFEKQPLVCEGGALEWDGRGTILTTETCLLNPNRNPGMSKAEVEAALIAATGARKVIWLPGSEVDTVTDGHIDGIARFVRDGVAICEITDDPSDPEFTILRENLNALRAATDADGQPIEVVPLLRPDFDEMPERGESFAASYANFYAAGDGSRHGLIVPVFGDDGADAHAHDVLRRLHPGYEIVPVVIDQIAEGGGGIHCNTQQIPAF